LARRQFIEALKFVAEKEYEGRGGHVLLEIAGQLESQHDFGQWFCACFTPVSDTLPMWREYGDNYRGVAIGFRTTASNARHGQIEKVHYLNPNTGEDFRKLVGELMSKFPAPGMAKLAAAFSMRGVIATLKHHTWDYEREVRLVFSQ